jgi:hypothetical protein
MMTLAHQRRGVDRSGQVVGDDLVDVGTLR